MTEQQPNDLKPPVIACVIHRSPTRDQALVVHVNIPGVIQKVPNAVNTSSISREQQVVPAEVFA